MNEVGRLSDGYVIVGTANSALSERLSAIENNSYMTPKEKKQAMQESLKIHATMIQAKPQGTFDRMSKVEAHQHMMTRAFKAFKALFGK